MENKQMLLNEAIEKMDAMVRVMDESNRIVYMNQKMRTVFGDQTGKKCFELMCQTDKCQDCVSIDCRKKNEPSAKDMVIGDKKYRIVASPTNVGEGQNYAIEIFSDVTKERRMEEENLRHYELIREDLRLARQVQSRTLPINGEYWDSLSIASRYKPCEDLGGDIFDVVKIDENQILLYIADVCGHGIRSSLVTVFLRQIIRGMKTEAADLEKLLNELTHNYNQLNISEEQYFTILAGVYNIEKREVTFVNGGHNCLPLILRKSGELEEISVLGMPVCSLFSEAEHLKKSAPVEKGDRIFLYTDGITEAYNRTQKKFFGTEGLFLTIRSHKTDAKEKLLEQVMDRVFAFSEEKQEDDIAILIAEIL